MTLTVADLIAKLQQLPDPTAPVAFLLGGKELRIAAVSLNTMRVHTIDAEPERDDG